MSLSLSTILPHKPVSRAYSREECMADQAPSSGVMQHRVARGATALLGTHSPAPSPAPAQGTAEGGSRRNHRAQRPVQGSQKPQKVVQTTPAAALQHQPCRRQWLAPRGPGAPLQGTRSCQSHLDNYSFLLIFRLQGLGKRAHKSLEREGETPQGPELAFSVRTNFADSRGPAGAHPVVLKRGRFSDVS